MAVTSGTATVTAKTGPDQAMTAVVMNNVVGLDFQLDRGVVGIRQSSPPNITYIELSNLATATINLTTGAIVLST